MINREELKNFLSNTPMGVISTLCGEQTQSAAVGVTFIPEKFEFVVGTSVRSRKYKNIGTHSKVSIAVWHERLTLQVEGTAIILDRKNSKFMDYQNKVVEIHPYKRKFVDDPLQIWVVIKPHWLRLTDISVEPWEIQEEAI